MSIIHTNPAHLNYYFSGAIPSTLKLEVLNRLEFQTGFGQVELAIIGSSHYVKYNNTYLELLTCTNEQFEPDALIKQLQKNNFDYNYQTTTLNYQIQVREMAYSNHAQFRLAEADVLQKKPIMHRYFSNDEAITAIDYKLTETAIIVETWHGYPDYFKLIYSKSRFEVL